MFSERTALKLDQEAWAAQDARDRHDQTIREERWRAFVDELRAVQRQRARWDGLCLDVFFAMSALPISPIEVLMREFAEAEGWPSVLRAMAQAMDADAAERRL
jgi:hypothetical protein